MRLGAADAVAWVEVEVEPDDEPDEPGPPEVVVALVPQGPPLSLRGSSALIWLAAVAGGTPDEVVARVAEASGQPAEVVDHDVRALLDDLVSRGMLAQTSATA